MKQNLSDLEYFELFGADYARTDMTKDRGGFAFLVKEIGNKDKGSILE